MSPIPLDFEDAREQMAWKPIENAFIVMTRDHKRQERIKIIREHRAWEKHWRTRLYIFLMRLAVKVHIDEPAIPNPIWREMK